MGGPSASHLMGSPAYAADETPKNMIASQVRRQGSTCKNPQTATRDQALSRPDETVWILTCENATYRVRLMPHLAAKIPAGIGRCRSDSQDRCARYARAIFGRTALAACVNEPLRSGPWRAYSRSRTACRYAAGASPILGPGEIFACGCGVRSGPEAQRRQARCAHHTRPFLCPTGGC